MGDNEVDEAGIAVEKGVCRWRTSRVGIFMSSSFIRSGVYKKAGFRRFELEVVRTGYFS